MKNFKILFAFFMLVNILIAQDSNLEIREYSSREGLSQSVVNCVIQDSKGFVWAGTQDGLNKFDGYHFKVFKPDAEDSTSISHNHIWTIVEDSKNNLWIGTYGGGLNFYDYKNEKFIHYVHSEKNSNSINGDDVRAIFEDNKGVFWIGTKNGLNSFNPAKNKWTNYSIGTNPALPYKNIRNIYPYSENELWLACYGIGLVLFNTETQKSFLYAHSKLDNGSLSSNNVWKIIKDRRGIYWVITFGGGVNVFDYNSYNASGKIIFRKFFDSEIDKNVTAIYETDEEKIFIGTDTQGMFIVDSSRKNLTHIKLDIKNPKGLTNNGVWSFCKNSSGGYWIGTFGGGLNFLQYKNSSFEHISTTSSRQTLNNPIVFCIEKTNKDEYLVGTYGGGLNKINMSTEEAKYFTENNSNIASNYITDIVIENSTSYWLGTDGNGVSKYNNEKNTFINYNTSNNDKLPNDFVKCMLIDSYKNIWVGTLQGLCNIQESQNVASEFYSDSVFKYDTRALLEIVPGKILIGTHGEGIFVHDIKNGTFEKLKNELIENQQITALYKKRDDILWIGTRGRGLIMYHFENNQAKLFTEKNGLCNNTVLGIEQDKFGNLWIITNNGISKFDPNSSLFANYFAVDGLLSNEFVQGAIYKDEHEIIYAGNIKGIEMIDPAKFATSKFNPPIEISKLNIMDEDQSLSNLADSRLELSYRENFIRIDFSSLDFTLPGKNRYRYKLTPGNSDWVHLGTEHTVNFANLATNKYLLELNGSNSDGVWSTNVKSIAIIISPPFYNTFWFYSFLVFIIGFVIYRFHYLRQHKKLEMEKLRLKIASDLHDEVGSSLSQIAINADMINYEADIQKIKSKSEFIRIKSGEMISAMNDVIWSIDSRNDRLESLVERIKNTVNLLSSSKEILTKIETELQNPYKKLNVNLRQNIYLIAKESVNNSVKYSGCNLIKISFVQSDRSIKLCISDNGKGLPSELTHSGNGIKNIIYRAKSINGKIEFVSKNGLTINLEVPIK